jgi:hypothetical protein
MAGYAYTERAPRDDEVVEDYVFVYRNRPMPAFHGPHGHWVRVHYTRAVCGDCDAPYDAATWIWDEDTNGDPMLVCECGGQLYSTNE